MNKNIKYSLKEIIALPIWNFKWMETTLLRKNFNNNKMVVFMEESQL